MLGNNKQILIEPIRHKHFSQSPEEQLKKEKNKFLSKERSKENLNTFSLNYLEEAQQQRDEFDKIHQEYLKTHPEIKITPLEHLKERLANCGQWATISDYCKKVPGREHLIKKTHVQCFCENGYCDSPDCLVCRFKSHMDTLQSIKRFEGLKYLEHFVLGFPLIPLSEFQNNYNYYCKKYQSVINRYFSTLKKEGLEIPAVKVHDFSFEKVEGDLVFPHYHFGAIPFGRSQIREVKTHMQKVRMRMNSKMKDKRFNFHYESFGLHNKNAVLSYLAIRASGLYKYNTTTEFNYKFIQGDLRASIESKKYLLLKDVLTPEQYLKSFYRKAHFSTVGGLPRPVRHGSNITDNIPCECSIHGHLERKEVRREVIFDDKIDSVCPPPDFSRQYEEIIESKIVESRFSISEANLELIRKAKESFQTK